MVKNFKKLCDYGCGQEAKYQFKNGKWCCSKWHSSCQKIKKKNSNLNKGRIFSGETKRKIKLSKLGKKNPMYGKTTSKKQKNAVRLSIRKIKEKYSFFSKIEEMRYNPNNPKEREIQVHCKNHLCINSKEQDGWFTPTYIQLYERIRHLEKDYGSGGCYFYCSEGCKNICPLYKLRSDPYKDGTLSYTQQEYQSFRQFVLERDNYECQFCGEQATDVHHEKPQKLEPFFALDPDFAWSCCEQCHYEKGHSDECSTGNLASKIC